MSHEPWWTWCYAAAVEYCYHIEFETAIFQLWADGMKKKHAINLYQNELKFLKCLMTSFWLWGPPLLPEYIAGSFLWPLTERKCVLLQIDVPYTLSQSNQKKKKKKKKKMKSAQVYDEFCWYDIYDIYKVISLFIFSLRKSLLT
jgi:hypothetical protein